jgi:hypothetical protein
MTGCPSACPMLPLHKSPCNTDGLMGPAPSKNTCSLGNSVSPSRVS